MVAEYITERFKDSAKVWWDAKDPAVQMLEKQNWDVLRAAIFEFFVNDEFLDEADRRSVELYYREPKHSHETPFEYAVRKHRALDFAHDWSISNIIKEIMSKAPKNWKFQLKTTRYKSIEQLKNALKANQAYLIEAGETEGWPRSRYTLGKDPHDRQVARIPKRRPYGAVQTFTTDTKPVPRSNPGFPAGWGNYKPPFPKDDKTVSKGRTPEMMGGRPCRNCGSRNHWDKDCKHNKQGSRQARVMFTEFNSAALREELEYEEMYESRFDKFSEDEHEPEVFSAEVEDSDYEPLSNEPNLVELDSEEDETDRQGF
jgi:hypothetical protein